MSTRMIYLRVEERCFEKEIGDRYYCTGIGHAIALSSIAQDALLNGCIDEMRSEEFFSVARSHLPHPTPQATCSKGQRYNQGKNLFQEVTPCRQSPLKYLKNYPNNWHK